MNIGEFILFLILLIFSVSAHELFHGWTAYKLGDPTAKYMGRLTLNPLAHIDPFGTIIFPFLMFLCTGFAFAWAKPVPINSANLTNPKRDMTLVGLAGPAANFLLAWLLSLILKTNLITGGLFMKLLSYGVTINLILAVFNLIPVPPLDGSRVLMGLLPYDLALAYAKLEPYGFLILLALVYLKVINSLVKPVVDFLTKILIS